jgi:hypothetical protein
MNKLIVITLVLLMVGCQGFKVPLLFDNPEENINRTSEKITDVADGIDRSADKIEDEAKTIQVETEKPTVHESASLILVEVDTLKEYVDDLNMVKGVVEETKKEVAQLQSVILKQQETIDKYQQEERQVITAILGFVVIGGVISVGIAIFLLFQGAKMVAVGLGAAGIVSATVSVAVITWWDHMVWLGVGASVVLMLVVGWQGLLVLREARLKAQVAEETIDTIEEIKNSLPEDQQKEIFKRHSMETKDLVARIKARKKAEENHD